jgi:farnesyl-diphosphate farnesyltransferase
MLQAVSRTFAIPVSMLRPTLERTVTCAYLLCRIADTIEDHDGLGPDEKEQLFGRFLAVLERGEPPEGFALAMLRVPGDSPDLALCRSLPRVMVVLDEAPESRDVVVRWVGELTRGMAIYARRPAGEDGLVALGTLADLERYCYFVAGTVGHLLTDLFAPALELRDRERLHVMRSTAEEFGLGLQLVNILKDVTDDQARGWSFIPRQVCAAHGLRPADLLRPERRRQAHAAVRPVFDRAERALLAALEYALAVPPDAPDVRLFCLLPLWMAVRTLQVARGNDAQFVPGEAVKIDRPEVAAIVEWCRAHCTDDERLRDGFAALSGGSREAAANLLARALGASLARGNNTAAM